MGRRKASFDAAAAPATATATAASISAVGYPRRTGLASRADVTRGRLGWRSRTTAWIRFAEDTPAIAADAILAPIVVHTPFSAAPHPHTLFATTAAIDARARGPGRIQLGSTVWFLPADSVSFVVVAVSRSNGVSSRASKRPQNLNGSLQEAVPPGGGILHLYPAPIAGVGAEVHAAHGELRLAEVLYGVLVDDVFLETGHGLSPLFFGSLRRTRRQRGDGDNTLSIPVIAAAPHGNPCRRLLWNSLPVPVSSGVEVAIAVTYRTCSIHSAYLRDSSCCRGIKFDP